MGAGASNRITRMSGRQADADVSPQSAVYARLEGSSLDRDVLRARVRELERELSRARRALAESRLTVTLERERAREAVRILEEGIPAIIRPDRVESMGFAACPIINAINVLGGGHV